MLRHLTFSFLVVFGLYTSTVTASESFRSQGICDVDELKALDIFDDLFIKMRNLDVNDPITSKRIQHSDAFGWRKPTTYLTTVIVGTMGATVIYPPAIPFILWSLKTKLAIGTVAACVGMGIMKQNADRRFLALRCHNRHEQNMNEGYYQIQISYPWELYVRPLQKYVAFTIGIGAAIGFMGLAYNRYKMPV
jgi:hypothetical protein